MTLPAFLLTLVVRACFDACFAANTNLVHTQGRGLLWAAARLNCRVALMTQEGDYSSTAKHNKSRQTSRHNAGTLSSDSTAP